MTATARSTEVRFPRYRQYEAARQDANNAMMALLAGSEIAAHMLKLTAGSDQLLPDMFPQVRHIQYFRLKTERAAELLTDNGHHLAAVAIPYALAVHEDFVTDCIEMLVSELGATQRAPGSKADHTKNVVKAWNMHEALEETVTNQNVVKRIKTPMLELFHLLREMRNCHIHDGGTVSANLTVAVHSLSGAAAREWQRLARRPHTDLIAQGSLNFTTFDIFTAFAVTKALGRDINTLLRTEVGAAQWAKLAIDDYMLETSNPPRSDQWMLGLLSFTRVTYGPAGVTENDLKDECVKRGLWRSDREVPRRSQRSARNLGTQHPGRLAAED